MYIKYNNTQLSPGQIFLMKKIKLSFYYFDPRYKPKPA